MKNEEKEKTIAEIKEKLAKSQVTDEEIGSELQRSFMEYAMSVIVARALPDIKDGFKPVHRRMRSPYNQIRRFPRSRVWNSKSNPYCRLRSPDRKGSW